MKSITRLALLLLKKQCKNPFFLGLLLLFPCLCLGIQHQLTEDSDQVIRVLLATDSEDEFTSAVMNDLDSKDGQILYDIVLYEEMISLLESGDADCGYYFQENLLERLLNGDSKDTVTLYIPDHSEFHMFTNEVVHAAVFHHLSPHYAEHFIVSQEHYEKVADFAEREITRNYQKLSRLYADSGIQIRTVSGDSVNPADTADILFPVRGVCGLFLSGVVLFAGASFQKRKEQGMLKAMPAILKPAYFPCLLFAAYVPAALSCLITMTLCRAGTFPENLLVLIWYFPILLVFSGILILITRKHTVQMAFLPFYLLAELLLCPIFWNLASILEIVNILEKFFPVSYFL